MAAWAPPASGAHRPTIRFTPTPGESFGLAGPPGKRPNLCRNFTYAAGPASSLYVSYGPCSSVPASGCHHRAVPDDPTGLTEQALNLFLPVVSPFGTRKTRTKSPSVTLSGRSADNLESGRPDNPPVSLINHPSTANCQPSIINRANLPEKELPSNDNRPVATCPPPLAAMSPPAGTPFLTGTAP